MAKNGEIWKDIDGFEGIYQISNYGRVKALPKYTFSRGYPQLRKEKMLKPYYTGKCRNYLTVSLSDGKQYKIHRLVAQAFIPNPHNYPVVNHKDENPSNNAVTNLEWYTHQYNIRYSAKPLSEAHKQKIREKHLGKRLSDRHKQHIGERVRERYSIEANRHKHSERMTEWWRKRKNSKET